MGSIKFAKFEYVKNIEEIPLKFNILKYAPKNVFSWYIDKYNPYILQDLIVGDELGYTVKLPFLEEDYLENPIKYEDLVVNIIRDLAENRVEMILLPCNMPIDNEIVQMLNDEVLRGVFFSKGKNIMLFLIYKIIIKSLKIVGKSLKNAEIIVIDEDESIAKTLCLVNCIYKEVNYLTIFSDNYEDVRYQELIEKVFEETGLRLHISPVSKKMLAEADVVVNLGKKCEKLDYHFKKNTIFVDLTENEESRKNLLYKREDMVIVDGSKLKYRDGIFGGDLLECIAFQKILGFREFVKHGNINRLGELIGEVDEMDIEIAMLTVFGRNSLRKIKK